MIRKIIFKIRSGKTGYFKILRKLVKGIDSINIPVFTPAYLIFFWERKIRLILWRWSLKVFYWTPLFKISCTKVGRNINIVGGLPDVNENLRVYIGDNVCIYAKETSFGGCKYKESPSLTIGDDTFIGPGVKIAVCDVISIGKNCLIAARVMIADSDGHPRNEKNRREKLFVSAKDVSPVVIEDDVWIGEGAYICKGVRIGQGAIVGTRSVVTRDVVPFTVVAGIPAKIISRSNHGEL